MAKSQENLSQSYDADPAKVPRIKVLVNKIQDLPTLPGVAVQALEAAMQDEVNISKLAGIIESDPALSMKLLKLVNSPKHNLAQKISTVHQAASYLGLTTLRCCLLGVITQDYLPQNKPDLLEHQKSLWSHSLACAVAAQLIAQKTYPELQQEAFLAGILHDIGKAVILLALPQEYIQIQNSSQCTYQKELEVLGCTHSQVGKWLASKWSLPERLVQTIHYHHHPPISLQQVKLHQELLWIIMLANQLAHDFFLDKESFFWNQGNHHLMNLLGLRQMDLEQINYQISSSYSQRAHLFELESDLEQILMPVLQRARQELSSISLQLDQERSNLASANRLLTLSKEMALEVGRADSAQDIFRRAARTFLEWDRFQAGVIYTVDMENKVLEGQVWLKSKQSRRFCCFLNTQGEPIWDQQNQNLPSSLKEIIASYYKRIPHLGPFQDMPEPVSIQYQAPFYILPLTSYKNNIQGELVLAPKQSLERLGRDDCIALQQITGLLLSALEKARVQENLEVRKEELSLALWKNQQMNQELMQTERLAAVGQLAAGAAHEINNPLAIINARAQLMQLQEDNPNKQYQFKQITEQIERISSILTNLMDFARPSPPQLQEVYLPDLLDKVSQLVEPALYRCEIRLEQEFSKDLPSIKADPNQLEQVFLNLLINAQQAMEDQGGRIQLHVEHDTHSQCILTQISDQGPGISAKDLKRIFDPFFSTKEPGKGTGLGLSTSLAIVESHYGKLDIQSTPGEGTTVTVQLPVNLESLRPDTKLAASKEQVQENSLNKPRILIVDDEEHIRDILKEALQSENMEPVCASQGEEALRLLQEESFELLLLDMRMPVLDGLSLIKSVREKGLDLPILVITGLASSEEIQEALGNGISKCIKKPFHIKSLLKDIYDILSKT
ncbi:MAG: HDOD domain-containing protein [Desulfohalobiaceae bacterium]